MMQRAIAVGIVIQQFYMRGGALAVLNNPSAMNPLAQLFDAVGGERRGVKERQIERVVLCLAKLRQLGNVDVARNANIRILQGGEVFKMLTAVILV